MWARTEVPAVEIELQLKLKLKLKRVSEAAGNVSH